MISFESDYICGAHPEVLRRLAETNLEPLSGYGYSVARDWAVTSMITSRNAKYLSARIMVFWWLEPLTASVITPLTSSTRLLIIEENSWLKYM